MRKLAVQFADDALGGSELGSELGRELDRELDRELHCVLMSGASFIAFTVEARPDANPRLNGSKRH